MAILTALASAAFWAAAESAPHAADAAHGAEHKGGMPQLATETFAGQLFWLAITFGLLYVLMSRVALPRITSIIADRRAKIESDLRDAAAAQKAAEDAAKAFEAGLAQAKAKAQGIAQSARDAAAKQADARRHSVEADLAAKLATAEAAIVEMKGKAMANVAAIAEDAAAAIVERLSGSAPKAADVAKAIAAVAKK